MRLYPFYEIGVMRSLDPPETGYYFYPATGEIVRTK